MQSGKHFNPVELTTVLVLIVGILAAVAIPLMKGRTAEAKWSGAIISASSIHKAVHDYAAQTGVAAAQALAGKNLGDAGTRALFDYEAADLESAYFTAADYTITSVDSNGVAAITVTGSKAGAPHGSYRLEANGNWVEQ